MFNNLIYWSKITTYNNEDFNKVVNAAEKGENELLELISSGISIDVKNQVNHKKLNKYTMRQ
jgi:hypothetical protein